MHFAAALAREQRYSLEFIAGRAYDLAEAMLTERERRIEAELDEAAQAEGPNVELSAFSHSMALLDEPAPPSERDELDPAWLEPPYDPAWDADKGPMQPAGDDASCSDRPGLARTTRDPASDPRRRSA
jgi:hypothetical protein